MLRSAVLRRYSVRNAQWKSTGEGERRALLDAMRTAIATKGEQYSPEGKMPVRAVAEDHVRSAFYEKYIDGEADKTSSADAQKAAFKRTLKKLLGEKFVFGEKDGGGNSMLWFASAEENYLAGVFSISGSHLVRLVPQLESGQNCSDCLFRLAQPASEGLSGSYATEANLDQFVRSRNVERCRRLLERVTEESDRQKIINLLAEERQKQKDSGDPVW